jgi:thiol-disulfide isomerase/thioredoxin
VVDGINRTAGYRSFSLKRGGPYQIFNREQQMNRICNRQRYLSSWIDGREGMRRSTETGLFKLFFLIVLFVSGATAANAGRGEISLLAEPKKLPEIVFYDESNNPVALDKWQGKVVLLNIWATWCPPCVKEMPTLDRLQKSLGGDFFQVLVLSVDEAGIEAVKKFFARTKVKNLDIHMDPGFKAAGALNALGLPTTILIDVKGREMGRLVGDAEWDAPEMISFFKGIIADQLLR